MADPTHGQSRKADTAPAMTEPPVRRWPHPVDGTDPAAKEDPALRYIRCALSYQNQLLAEIKVLLERLVVAMEEK